MKRISIVFLTLGLLFLSYFGYKYCSSTNLEFDEVYHYEIKDDNLPIPTITHTISNLKNAIVYDEYPNSLDNNFYSELKKVGYKRSQIKKVNFSKLKEILKYEINVEVGVSACETIFRDVLVFQKNNKIVGVVKICFDCGKYYSIGENLPDFNFEKYDELQELLKK